MWSLRRNNMEMNNHRHRESAWILMSPANHRVLQRFFALFQFYGVFIRGVVCRSSSEHPGEEFLAEYAEGSGDFLSAVRSLRPWCGSVDIYGRSYQVPVPWFPRRIQDLDLFVDWVLISSASLHPHDPAYQDEEYRGRRESIAHRAYSYKHGQPIPQIEYTQEDKDIWGALYRKFYELHSVYASRRHNDCFQQMIDNCGYSPDDIPKLEDVNTYLKSTTGFFLRPAPGTVSNRNFLAGLAFRVYPCARFVRHSSHLDSNDADICHVLLGYAPLLAHPAFAELAHQIGLASIGAPDSYIAKLFTCFWYTIKYGIIREETNGRPVLRAFGGSFLTAEEELRFSVSGFPEMRDFNPEATERYGICTCRFKLVLFKVDSFEEATNQIIEFSKTIPRNFTVNYNSLRGRLLITDVSYPAQAQVNGINGH